MRIVQLMASRDDGRDIEWLAQELEEPDWQIEVALHNLEDAGILYNAGQAGWRFPSGFREQAITMRARQILLEVCE
ncbi:hypothetical protein WMF38_57325 [Sorangium sp. So ce118]